MNVLQAPLIALLVCCVTAIPTPENGAQTTGVTSSGTSTSSYSTSNAQGQTVSNSQVVSAANGYVVKIIESQVNDKCESNLTIVGHGIDKTASYPCGKAPVAIINLNDSLVVGDEWFSDQKNTLIRLSDKQCVKEVFTEQDGKTTSTSETLSDEECEKVRSRITELKKEQQKWNDWLAQQQQAAQQQFQQLQQNLLWFQQQLFGNLFGGK